jgi:hypothetical protein
VGFCGVFLCFFIMLFGVLFVFCWGFLVLWGVYIVWVVVCGVGFSGLCFCDLVFFVGWCGFVLLVFVFMGGGGGGVLFEKF